MRRSDPTPVKDDPRNRWGQLHPLSGAAILVLDNVFFGLNAATAGLGTPMSVALAFWSSLLAVWFIQRKMGGDNRRMSILKALAAGLVAGVPFSIAGTAIGSWIILRSGLSPWRKATKVSK